MIDLYTKLLSTNGNVSVLRTDVGPLKPYAVRSEGQIVEILDTFDTRKEADDFADEASAHIRAGHGWPDPDQMSCTEIYPGGSIAVQIVQPAA